MVKIQLEKMFTVAVSKDFFGRLIDRVKYVLSKCYKLIKQKWSAAFCMLVSRVTLQVIFWWNNMKVKTKVIC